MLCLHANEAHVITSLSDSSIRSLQQTESANACQYRRSVTVIFLLSAMSETVSAEIIMDFCFKVTLRESWTNCESLDDLSNRMTDLKAHYSDYKICGNRMNFLYRYGLIRLSLTRDCVRTFMENYSDINGLMKQWIDCPASTLCLIGGGPGLDYVAFLLQFQEYFDFNKLPHQRVFKKLRFISREDCWNKTFEIIHEMLLQHADLSSVLPEDLRFTSDDPSYWCLKDSEFVSIIKESDVLLMAYSMNLRMRREEMVKSLEMLFETLKPGCFVFAVDSFAALAVLKNELSKTSGELLIDSKRLHVNTKAEISNKYSFLYPASPVTISREHFLVWQKSETPNNASDRRRLKTSHDKLSKRVKDSTLVHKPSDESSVMNFTRSQAQLHRRKIVQKGNILDHIKPRYKSTLTSNTYVTSVEDDKYMQKEANTSIFEAYLNRQVRTSKKLNLPAISVKTPIDKM